MFGKLIAMGGLDYDQSAVILAEGAERDGGEWGWWWRQRLLMKLADATRHWRGIRVRTDQAIRKRLAPMMQNRIAPARVMAAAYDENDAWNAPLAKAEVVAIVREEAAWWVRTAQRRTSYGR